jgi:hypothetical protein
LLDAYHLARSRYREDGPLNGCRYVTVDGCHWLTIKGYFEKPVTTVLGAR